ncbi:M23 family metallopeptidase [Sulfurospirillum sp. 1612]|uniref:M23 family metallopeptidase n=1 Tax=Sulfurospirillum sp. 1612 TaxID=3094835 RepID=UPI002F932906
MNKLIVPFLLIFSLLSALNGANHSVVCKAKVVGHDIVVTGLNKNPYSVTLVYDARYQSKSGNQHISKRVILQPNIKKEIVRIREQKGKTIFKSNYKWMMGRINAKYDKAYHYRLPYRAGSRQMVTQGFNGTFTHFGASQYAVDFNLKEGTGVYAARAGRVIEVKSDSNKGGPNRSFLKDANHIVIEHHDGTFALYAHLKQHGVVVRLGEQVRAGELIGYSGKTGYARGPHLHFVVYRIVNGNKIESLPIQFVTLHGILKKPVEHQWYVAR